MLHDIPLWLPLAVAAPFIGSFLGLLVSRLPRDEAVVLGRSHCDRCGTVIAIRDLVPIASWLILGGRCRTCRAPIDPLSLTIEFAALGVVLWAATVLSGGLLVATCLYGWLLLTLALIDAKTFLLPDPLNAALAAGGLGTVTLLMPDRLVDHLIGAALGSGLLWMVQLAYRGFRRREGLGFGDVKLLGALGVWVSWEGLAGVVLYAAGFGLLVGAIMSPRDRAAKLPFGPFLALGGWLVWLYGPLVLG